MWFSPKYQTMKLQTWIPNLLMYSKIGPKEPPHAPSIVGDLLERLGVFAFSWHTCPLPPILTWQATSWLFDATCQAWCDWRQIVLSHMHSCRRAPTRWPWVEAAHFGQHHGHRLRAFPSRWETNEPYIDIAHSSGIHRHQLFLVIA